MVSAHFCALQSIYCAMHKKSMPKPSDEPADKAKFILKPEQKDERSGYHKRIGNAAALVCPDVRQEPLPPLVQQKIQRV
jgi:hypothetical protein